MFGGDTHRPADSVVADVVRLLCTEKERDLKTQLFLLFRFALSEALREESEQTGQGSSGAQLRINQYLLNELAKLKSHCRRLEDKVSSMQPPSSSPSSQGTQSQGVTPSISRKISEEQGVESSGHSAGQSDELPQLEQIDENKSAAPSMDELSQLFLHLSALSSHSEGSSLKPWTAGEWYTTLSALGGSHSEDYSNLAHSAREPYETLAMEECRRHSDSERLRSMIRMAQVVSSIVDRDLGETKELQNTAEHRARVLQVCQSSMQVLMGRLKDANDGQQFQEERESNYKRAKHQDDSSK